MKPGKLYIKIFISFLAVLVITEILVFALFIFSAGRTFRERFVQSTGAKVLVTRDYIQETINREPNITPAENESLRRLIKRLADIYDADVWLATSSGAALVKSFPGDIPARSRKIMEKGGKGLGGFKLYRDLTHGKELGEYKLYHSFRRGSTFYAIIPVDIGNGETGDLHIFFKQWESTRPEASFALGLLVIGLIIALLIIPVSRLITQPLKKLKHSALQIAGGDLSHRANVTSKDEIGEVGRSFNLMADKLERMIRGGRELTANVSHELRSPLARIRIAEELLRECIDRGDYGECASHLGAIQEDIEELDRLIGRILVLSKLDIHEKSLKMESIDLAELIRELLERFRPAMSKRGLRLAEDLSYDAPFCGDREALGSALSNILDNVVKFTTPNGEVKVDLHPEPGGVEIGVYNSCVPPAEEDLGRLFEPFYRPQDSSAQGSGLGLAITKKIIEKHGGLIDAAGLAGGLQMKIFLPVEQPVDP